MTAKRKITDKNGLQVYPITHTKAVLDDNGNSVEQRLQENLDLINQKQLEVGAVPSDVTPTAGSTNWVTSGGVYNEVFIEETTVDDWTNASISYNYTNRISLVVTNQNTLTYNAVSNGGRAFIYFPVALKNGETYHISFDYTHSTNSNTSISFASAVGGDTIKSILLQGTSGSINCEYVHESAIKGFNIYSTQVVAGGELVLSNVRIYQVHSVKTDVEENKRTIGEWKEISIDVIDDFSDASVSTTASTMIIENNNGVFTITATVTGKRAFILFPNGLVDGNEYKLSFDYINSGGNNIPCHFASGAGEESQGAFSFGGAEGEAIGFFTKTSSIRGVYFTTTNIGAGNTLVIENMKIQIEHDAKWHIENLYKEDSSNKENLEQLNIENEYLPFKLNEYKPGVAWYSYEGASINPQNRIGYELYAELGSCQAGAIYGETMIIMYKSGSGFYWVNLRTKAGRKVNGVYSHDCPFLPSAMKDGGWHCNSAQFSEVFYDENDEFPLLYISGSEGEKKTMFLVARVVPYKDKYTYHLELVQTVTMPPSCTYANMGVEGNYLYMQRNFAVDNCSIFKCEIPAIFDGNGDVIDTVVMTDEDIVRTYTNAPAPANPQGVCVHKGILYSTWGGSGNSYLTAYDLDKGETINTIPLNPIGFNFEPEGLAFYKETLIINANVGGPGIYRFWI